MKKNIFKDRFTLKTLCAVLAASTLFSSGAAICAKKEAKDSRNIINSSYIRSYTDLLQYVDDIDSCLLKSSVTSSPEYLVMLSDDIHVRAASASSCLASLPLEIENTSNIAKFLSQVGEYSVALSSKYLRGDEISDQDSKNLKQMSDYAKSLCKSLYEMQDKVHSGEYFFSDDEKITEASSEVQDIESTFADYPSLIYDGPFSDHIEKKNPEMLKDAKEVSQSEAKKRAEQIFGEVHTGKDTNGKAECYTFVVKKSGAKVEITKKGGYLLSLTNSRNVMESNISVNKAVKYAKDFLSRIGTDDMKESYYETSGSVVIINFAYVQDGITVYPDLVKIKVALDNGEILGAECNGYLACHKEREISTNIMSEREAMKKLSPVLNLESSRLCIIPLKSGSEKLVYEFKGKAGENTFLVYINAETGAEEDILMLLISENGTLTI